MEQLEFEGGTYADATDKDHVALIWDKELAYSRGSKPLPAPGTNLIQVRISRDGSRFAGCGHEGPLNDVALEWIGGNYELRGSAAAQRSCIYDEGGQLIIARGNGTADIYASDGVYVATIGINSGSQGIRYLRQEDGFPVTSDDSNVHPRRVWQYTERGRFVVGQSSKGRYGEDALIVVEVTQDGLENRYVLSRGTNRFVNFYLYGELLVIAWWHESEKKARVWRLHSSELSQFERQLPENVDPGNGGPVAVTLPDPGAVEAAIVQELAKYGGRKMTNDEMGLVCNNVALKFEHCGLHAKGPGENTAKLPDGTTVNRNVIRFHPPDDPDFGWWADVLVGAGTGLPKATRPAWARGQDDRRSWVAPKNFGPAVPVDPPPSTTHRYIGGSNDTGTCDECGKPKLTSVHLVPEGKVPHEAWQGEDGKGNCDLCMKPVDDVIHRVVPPPPPPTDTHKFVGTGKFCSECGQPPGAAVHQVEIPSPQGVEALLKAILECLLRIEAQGSDPARQVSFHIDGKEIARAAAPELGRQLKELMNNEPAQ